MKPFTIIITIFVVFIIFSFSFSKENLKQVNHGLLKSTAGNTPYALMNANNVTSWVHSDGFFNWLVNQSWNGEFPKASGIGTIFSEGIVFGGFVSDGLYPEKLRVTGCTYFVGMQSGAIHADRTVDNPNELSSRAFGVRSDMPPTLAGNPSLWPDLTIDAATFLQKPQSSVTNADKAQIAAQYFTDWTEWPAVKGAPWYIDSIRVIRNDGAFNPNNAHHIPGIPSATKTIWFVSNDLDTSVSKIFAGSPPIGMEEQMTLWAYASSNPLNNIIFKQVKLIYKGNPGAPSNSRIDTMYIVQWADPDIGDAGDDFVGCDSLLNLGYCYNANVVDVKFNSIGSAPAAVGYALLQGASYFTGNPLDHAVVNFQPRQGYKYIHSSPLTGFNYFATGSALDDPDEGDYDGTLQWYNLMRGDLPRPEYPAGIPFYLSAPYATSHNIITQYGLSGDPIAASGWIDGIDLPPGDRRLVNIHGPVSMKLNDTIEIIVALVDGMGTDNLSSIKAMKTNVAFASLFYKNLFTDMPPQLSYTKTPTSPTTITIQADARGIDASSISINLRTYDDALVGSTNLSDDGLHSDGAAGDGIFGGSILVNPNQNGMYAEAAVTYKNGHNDIWNHLLDNISTALVSCTAFSIVSDNINNDGIANPGENVRYNFTLQNNSPLVFSNLTIKGSFSPQTQQLNIANFSSGTTFSTFYNPNDPSTYLTFVVPQEYSDSSITITLTVQDLSFNEWQFALVFPVKPIGKIYRSPLTQIAGDSIGNFVISVVDSSHLKNHLYVISGTNINTAGGTSGYSLKDSTTGQVLILNHPLPDALGHTSPIVDGFKILLGTIDTLSGMKEWIITNGIRRFSPVGGYTGLGLEGFSNAGNPTAYDQNSGTIGAGFHFAFSGIGSTLQNPSQYHSVLLKLAAVDTPALWNPKATPTDPNFSLAYRWVRHASAAADTIPAFIPWIISTGSGYPYQDFIYSVPFSAWDMATDPPTRLAVGMLENNDPGASVDGRYWPPAQPLGDNTLNREFAFIFSAPYSTTPVAAYQTNLSNNITLPLMWVMTCNRRANWPWVSGDEFEIIANSGVTSQDRWVFNTSILTAIQQRQITPNMFSLSQNYPNPFNPTTTIQYQLPALSRVTIKIYNILGQEIKTLIHDIQNAGPQTIVWNSQNDKGQTVATGIYFYRLEAVPVSGNGILFHEVKKMVLLK